MTRCCTRGRGDCLVSVVNLAADVQAAQLLALELFTGSGRGEAEAS